MPLWRETSVELSSLRSKGLHPRLYFSCLQFFFSILLHFHVATMYLVMVLSKVTLAVSVLLRPFTFEGRRHIDIEILLQKDLVTLDEALRNANNAVSMAASALISGMHENFIDVMHKDLTELEASEVTTDLNSSTKDSSSDTASTTILSEKYADFTKQRNLSARAASMLGCSTEDDCSRGDAKEAFLKERVVWYLEMEAYMMECDTRLIEAKLVHKRLRVVLFQQRFYSKSGEIFFGHFKYGWRHGEFLCIDVAGTRYSETWDDGVLIDQKRVEAGH
ncbi:hypothetical protein HID58_047446 [Brassica napus]|uniref:Uncharacterized protein n=1 Tax=Brassica napus TaxID=3708 RepID=A0ABQ8B0A1_BRANA|nr:hypothetical protein HID58_047446 [Brassica napus]